MQPVLPKELKNEIMALTPNRRFLLLNDGFNQVIRWLGRARLVPQALRACEIMNDLGVPRNETQRLAGFAGYSWRGMGQLDVP